MLGEVGALRSHLDHRERTILYLRFVKDLTQMEIARRVGVSQRQVSRILRRTLQRLADRAGRASGP